MNDWTVFMTTHITGPLTPAARRWAPLIVFPASLLILAAIGAVASLRPAAQARPQPVILLATAVRPSPVPSPTVAPRAILGFFDYDNPRSAVALNQGDVARVIGQAGPWRLIETAQGGRAWVGVADVPAGVPSDSPLPDLAPPTAVPAPTIIYVTVPAAPAVEPTPAHFEMPSDRPGPGERVPVQQVR